MLHLLAAQWWQIGPEWLWHPLGQCSGMHAEVIRCRSYNFHSGIAANFGELALLVSVVTALTAWWFKHNCHVHRCLRLSWHPDKDGHPICKVHHGDHPALGWWRHDRTHPRHASQRQAATVKSPNREGPHNREDAQ